MNRPIKPVKAEPTKQFFVEMLTRDIELDDAILDLLDNCVDGVQRQLSKLPPNNSETPYEGAWVKIVATPDYFSIEDNCGGIPEQIAMNEAFMMGRPTDRDASIPTVGMYGIGMKRAIFKMGREAVVISEPEGEAPFKVEINNDWLGSLSWDLELVNIDGTLGHYGTKIHISKLIKNIRNKFEPGNGTFLDDLEKKISQFYSFIITKGLKVSLNGREIKPQLISLLSPDNSESDFTPFMYKGIHDDVEVSIHVGFYQPLKTEDPEDKNRSSEKAGWTIICNDRVVLFADKTINTGWGRVHNGKQVPNYHTQFISIAGVVRMRSLKSNKSLPLTTTKRGLEYDSELYTKVLGIMMDGLRQIITFTNNYKKFDDEGKKDVITKMGALKSTSIKELDSNAEKWGKELGKTAHKKLPIFPKYTASKERTQISFEASDADIDTVSKYLFGRNESARKVGEGSFMWVLKAAKSVED